jgi:signal transduction histidine kinase/HPt (histidine-containing phosphotransfer) domain-containing protein
LTMSSPLQEFLSQLGYALVQRDENGTFSLLSPAPDWFMQLWPAAKSDEEIISFSDSSPFLESFLSDAEIFWKSAQTGFCESGTWVEKTSNGQEIALEAKALTQSGKHLLAIHSPEKLYEEKVQVLQTARNSLLEHEKLLREIQKKEILLHCIVHDLSQPLSAMLGSFDCLALEVDPKNAAKFIELGKHAGQQQELMIREILSAFSAELQVNLAAEQDENSAPDLLVVAKEAKSEMSPAFAAKGVRLFLTDKIPANMDWQVNGEKTRLQRVFTNLLENALRYTPAGSGVTIGIEDEGGFLKAFVDDEGPGLPADLRPAEMFALFGKGKKSGGKAGLGLYFCRITVERWGGSIGCSSLAEIGSRFWFRLPKAVSNGKPAHNKKTEQRIEHPEMTTHEMHRGLHILLAEDQADIRLLTKHQLERHGHEVMAVGDGQAALEHLKTGEFDILLLDEEMPKLSGVQVASAVRELQKEREKRSVIVALTGNNTPFDRERLLAAGFDQVIGKPFRLETLAALLLDPTKVQAIEDSDDPRPAKESSSWDELLQRVGGDEKLLRQMIRTFLRETPIRMEAMKKALHRSNGAELGSSAHALKGSLGIFGAAQAVKHAQSLEDFGRRSDFPAADKVYGFLQEDIAKLQQNLRGYAKHTAAIPSSAPQGNGPKSKAKELHKRKR